MIRAARVVRAQLRASVAMALQYRLEFAVPADCLPALRELSRGGGATMFMTTLVPVGALASTPPSLTSASATVSAPMLIWNAAASL